MMCEKLKNIGKLCKQYRELNGIKCKDILRKADLFYNQSIYKFEKGESKSLVLFITYLEFMLGRSIEEWLKEVINKK